MKFRSIILIVISNFLFSCTNIPVKPDTTFQLSKRNSLYKLSNWSFSGRLAYSDAINSFSASIDWKHQEERDEVELAGPLGQGRTLVIFTSESVVFDFGDKRLEYSENVDTRISRELGIAVSVSALKYWVLGLVEPKTPYVEFENGFLQSEWHVKYPQMQEVGIDQLPRKIKAEKGNTKLKLIINQWNLGNWRNTR